MVAVFMRNRVRTFYEKSRKIERELVCAPHRVKILTDLAVLEVADSAVIDDRPISLYTLRNILTLEVREVLGSTNCDIKRRHGIELVTTVRGAKAIAKAHGIVAPPNGGNDADLLPPPIADILEDNIVRRISHRCVCWLFF
jgi:hypothetical protein